MKRRQRYQICMAEEVLSIRDKFRNTSRSSQNASRFSSHLPSGAEKLCPTVTDLFHIKGNDMQVHSLSRSHMASYGIIHTTASDLMSRTKSNVSVDEPTPV